MSIIELVPVIWFHDPMAAEKGAVGIITRLWKVQCTHEPCPKNTTGVSMDGYTWRCPQCKTVKSIRHGSFFQSLNCRCLNGCFLCSYGLGSTQSVTQLTMQIYLKTTIDTYQFFRDVCTTKLLQAPIKLGGPGVVVQTEELLFNHKPKVSALLCNVVFIHIIKLFIQVMDIISNSTVPPWPWTSAQKLGVRDGGHLSCAIPWICAGCAPS